MISKAYDQLFVLVGYNALVIVTEWKSFRSLDFEKLIQKLTHLIIFD